MKKNISYQAVMTGLFCAFLGLGAALSVFMPRRTFSETENRYLAKRPALTWEAVKSGKFGSDYEIYLSDQFPFRDSWIGFKTAAEKVQLKKEINGVFLGKDGYLIEAFYAEDMDPELSKKNLDALAAFALRQEALLGDGHVKVLLAPTASEILTEKLPASASPFSQEAATDFLEKAGLSSMLVPVRDALLQEEADGPDRPFITGQTITGLPPGPIRPTRPGLLLPAARPWSLPVFLWKLFRRTFWAPSTPSSTFL